MTKGQMYEFISRLISEEGLNLRYDTENDIIAYDCDNPDFNKARAILTKMKIPLLEQCGIFYIATKSGGACDCGIILKAHQELIKSVKD